MPRTYPQAGEAMVTREDAERRVAEVFGAGGREDLIRAYAGWAECYDQDTLSLDLRGPEIVAAMAARHLRDRASPILDAGAGTGRVGELLAILGYDHLVALDLSEAMLARARERGTLWLISLRRMLAAISGQGVGPRSVSLRVGPGGRPTRSSVENGGRPRSSTTVACDGGAGTREGVKIVPGRRSHRPSPLPPVAFVAIPLGGCEYGSGRVSQRRERGLCDVCDGCDTSASAAFASQTKPATIRRR